MRIAAAVILLVACWLLYQLLWTQPQARLAKAETQRKEDAAQLGACRFEVSTWQVHAKACTVAVADMQERCTAEASQSDQAASEALARSHAQGRALLAGRGPAAMNLFFRELYP